MSEQTSEQKSEFEDLKGAARDQLLAELIAAIAPNEPPEDAFTYEDICDKTGWTKNQAYEYGKKALREGKIEFVGQWGRVNYYRKVKK